MESMDKGGNFIGYLHADGLNLSVSLVEEGLAKVHFTAERGNYFKSLTAAEERAKAARKNVSVITFSWAQLYRTAKSGLVSLSAASADTFYPCIRLGCSLAKRNHPGVPLLFPCPIVVVAEVLTE